MTFILNSLAVRLQPYLLIIYKGLIMSDAVFVPPLPYNEKVREYRPGVPETLDLKSELTSQLRSQRELEAFSQYSGGKQKIEIICPHDHQKTIATAASASEKDTKDAISTALAARKAWSELPFEERASVFLRAADLLAGPYRSKMNAATMLGQSKTVYQAEIDAACELADFFRFNVSFAQQIYARQPYSPPGLWNRCEMRGLEGFVFAIGPFNFTSIAINLAAAPALMGSVVLWKPSDTSLYGCQIGYEILKEAGLPDGVIVPISGQPREIASVALSHQDLAGVHFTGSTQTFQNIWGEVGAHLSEYKTYPRLVGETGGKDFILAHESADPESLVTALIRGAFEYQGQKCSAASRAYVPKSLWAEIKDSLINKVEALKMGDPSDFSNFMAAVIDERAFQKISGFIERAQNQKNCQVIAGGQCNKEKGYFIRPTLIETSDPQSETMINEIFGPVLTIYPYSKNEADQITKLVDSSSPYALTGAIFAKDRHVIGKWTQELRYAAGNFYINDKPTGAVVGQQPFGGARQSGTNDKAGSELNLLRWCSARTIKETFVAAKEHEYPHME